MDVGGERTFPFLPFLWTLDDVFAVRASSQIVPSNRRAASHDDDRGEGAGSRADTLRACIDAFQAQTMDLRMLY